MADSTVPVTGGVGYSIDTRTESTNLQHRQVVVIGDPVLNANVAAVASQDVGASDQTTPASLVRMAGSAVVVGAAAPGAAVAGNPVQIGGSDGTNARRLLTNSEGAIKIYDIVNGTVTVGSITGITNTVAVYFQGSSPAVSVEAKYGATKVPLLGNTDGAIKVYDVVNGTIGVSGITNSVAVYFQGSNPAVTAYGMYGATKAPVLVNTDGAIKVYDIVTGTINTVASLTNITNSIAVHVLSTNGTIAANIGTIAGSAAVYFSPSGPVVQDISGSFIIGKAGSTASGSTSTAGGSGANTVVSPTANYNTKVYAFSLTTTAQVGISPRFTTGGSAGATELWRVALQAPSQGIAGANLAVTPPGYLFATGVGNTLALYLDSASLVHYSVSYFKESA